MTHPISDPPGPGGRLGAVHYVALAVIVAIIVAAVLWLI